MKNPCKVKEIIIGDDCCIGVNITILGGVHIGKGSIVGAGSLVNKSVPDLSII